MSKEDREMPLKEEDVPQRTVSARRGRSIIPDMQSDRFAITRLLINMFTTCPKTLAENSLESVAKAARDMVVSRMGVQSTRYLSDLEISFPSSKQLLMLWGLLWHHPSQTRTCGGAWWNVSSHPHLCSSSKCSCPTGETTWGHRLAQWWWCSRMYTQPFEQKGTMERPTRYPERAAISAGQTVPCW